MSDLSWTTLIIMLINAVTLSCIINLRFIIDGQGDRLERHELNAEKRLDSSARINERTLEHIHDVEISLARISCLREVECQQNRTCCTKTATTIDRNIIEIEPPIR